MKVFVTGASGFVGSAIVQELLSAGHQVLGMVRSTAAGEKLKSLGAEAHLGDLYDLPTIKAGAAQCQAVIHTGFDHDFSRYKEACENDRKVITALGEALAGTDKPLVVTSGIGLLSGYDRPVTEDDEPIIGLDVMPRIATEEAAKTIAAAGVNVYILRLPPSTHGAGDHGFVPMLVEMAKANGASAYLDKGHNLWPAVHRFDAAALYRLIIEQQPQQNTYHAVAEEGIPFRLIAEAIGEGLNLETLSKTGDAAAAHFTWFQHFAGMDVAASGKKTMDVIGWVPTQAGLLEDINTAYFN